MEKKMESKNLPASAGASDALQYVGESQEESAHRQKLCDRRWCSCLCTSVSTARIMIHHVLQNQWKVRHTIILDKYCDTDSAT